MLVYRNDDEVVDTRQVFDRLVTRIEQLNRPGHDDVMSVFVDFGELESAIADRVFARADGIHPLATALRFAALQAAHALLASWRHEFDRRDQALATLLKCVRRVSRHDLPRQVRLRVSEGYAFYALRPEAYAAAAERWLADVRPASAVCIGIRSIGCSLSAMVAATVERHGLRVATHTVRPRGHPFDRQVTLDEHLVSSLLSVRGGTCFLIVDEGPGLSGSSFASAARALRQLGIPSDRIILFPSSNPDGSAFRSETARAIWNDHRRCVASSQDAPCSIECCDGQEGGVDISGGGWRKTLWHLNADIPAVHPQHEVIKYWSAESSTIVRFAGLGRYGVAKLQRAERLAESGLGPLPVRLRGGYLSLPFVQAASWGRACDDLIDAIARHCASATTSFPARRSPSVGDLFQMIVTNVNEGCGGKLCLPELEQFRPVLDAAPCAAIDGRMFPHEWLDTDGRFIKVDALDHHQDHFFPGTQDAGWDLAAAAFEFNLDESGRARLVAKYVAQSRDGDIARRLPFYDLAYPAFRLGYAVMAAESLGDTDDGRRFGVVAEKCRARLAQVIPRFSRTFKPPSAL